MTTEHLRDSWNRYCECFEIEDFYSTDYEEELVLTVGREEFRQDWYKEIGYHTDDEWYKDPQ